LDCAPTAEEALRLEEAEQSEGAKLSVPLFAPASAEKGLGPILSSPSAERPLHCARLQAASSSSAALLRQSSPMRREAAFRRPGRLPHPQSMRQTTPRVREEAAALKARDSRPHTRRAGLEAVAARPKRELAWQSVPLVAPASAESHLDPLSAPPSAERQPHCARPQRQPVARPNERLSEGIAAVVDPLFEAPSAEGPPR
jgi:hypothetical protein